MKITATFIKAFMQAIESVCFHKAYNARLEFDSDYEKIIRFETIDNVTGSIYFYNSGEKWGYQVGWVDDTEKYHFIASCDDVAKEPKEVFYMNFMVNMIDIENAATEFYNKRYEDDELFMNMARALRKEA